MKKLVLFGLGLFLCTSTWAAGEREITVELSVPDTTWEISIDRVYQVGNELWVIATVARDPDRMGASVISTLRDAVKISADDLPVKVYVIGKTWNWENEEPYIFIKDLNAIVKELNAAKLLYPKN